MITSLLSMANNALCSSHYKLARPSASVSSAGGIPYDEEQAAETQAAPLQTSSAASSEDRFAASLAARLRETGLTGPEAPEKIAEVTAQAQETVSRIRREEGAAEANRAKALILTAADAGNASQVIAGVTAGGAPAPAGGPPPAASEEEEEEDENHNGIPDDEEEADELYGVAAAATEAEEAGEDEETAAEDLKASVASPSADSVASRAGEKVADEAEAEAASAPPPPPPQSGGPAEAYSAVKSALDEIEAFAPSVSKEAGGIDLFTLVNKAGAAVAARTPASGFGAYAEASVTPKAYQAAYSGRLPNPGSLLSVRV
jgi:hypothetical protein